MDAFNQDLRWLGFNGTFSSIQARGNSGNYDHEMLRPNSNKIFGTSFVIVGAKPVNRFLAFVTYGFRGYGWGKSKKGDNFSHDDYGRLLGGMYPTKRVNFNKLVKLVFETISAATKIMKEQESNSSTDADLFAAYLFRAASVNGNPKDKDVQEKALIIWRKERNLDVAWMMRGLSLEEVLFWEDAPDSWVREMV